MTGMPVGPALGTLILGLIIFVMRREYPDIARRLACHLIIVATRSLPEGRRERLREEWLAEVEAVAADDTSATGFGFGLGLAMSYWCRLLFAAAEPGWPTGLCALALALGVVPPRTAIAVCAFNIVWSVAVPIWLSRRDASGSAGINRWATRSQLVASLLHEAEATIAAISHDDCGHTYEHLERQRDRAAASIESAKELRKRAADALAGGRTRDGEVLLAEAAGFEATARGLLDLAHQQIEGVRDRHVKQRESMQGADKLLLRARHINRQSRLSLYPLRSGQAFDSAVSRVRSVSEVLTWMWVVGVGSAFVFYCLAHRYPVVAIIALHIALSVLYRQTRDQRRNVVYGEQ